MSLDANMLNLNFDDNTELKMLDDGAEVKLRIESAEIKQSQKGNTYINVRCCDPTDDHVDDIYHMVMIPTEELRQSDWKKWAKTRDNCRDFMEACGLDPSKPINISQELVGCEFDAIVGVQEADGQYPERNNIKKVIKPR